MEFVQMRFIFQHSHYCFQHMLFIYVSVLASLLSKFSSRCNDIIWTLKPMNFSVNSHIHNVCVCVRVNVEYIIFINGSVSTHLDSYNLCMLAFVCIGALSWVYVYVGVQVYGHLCVSVHAWSCMLLCVLHGYEYIYFDSGWQYNCHQAAILTKGR